MKGKRQDNAPAITVYPVMKYDKSNKRYPDTSC